MTRRILVAVDDGASSERVGAFVNRFFDGSADTIIAVNVGRSPLAWGPYAAAPGAIYAWPYFAPALPLNRTPPVGDRREAARDAGHEAVEASGIDADEEVVIDAGTDVAEILRRVATERGVDLLVVGSTHKGLLERLVSPSVSAELAKDAPIPVLVVH